MTNDVGGTRNPEIKTRSGSPPLDLTRVNSSQGRNRGHDDQAPYGPPPEYTEVVTSQKRSQSILGSFKRTLGEEIAAVKRTFKEEIAGAGSTPVNEIIESGGGWRLPFEPVARLGGVGLLGVGFSKGRANGGEKAGRHLFLLG